ncbi:hypothetical protein FB451DRAFT_1196532 [Mycena latifolia]|nr:hypothetical protein FB451DRAFT_1196532 [Mycena latifolia]
MPNDAVDLASRTSESAIQRSITSGIPREVGGGELRDIMPLSNSAGTRSGHVFDFLLSDDITPAPRRAQTTPHDTLPTLPATDSTPSSSEAFNTFVSSSSPCDAPTFSDPSPDRYIPKAFVYNTPINSGVFGSRIIIANRTLPPPWDPHNIFTPRSSSCNQHYPGETHFEQYEAGELKTRQGRGNVWELNCSLCDHLAAAHPEYASPLSPEGIRLPHDVWEAMKLAEGEERALGIPEAKIPAIFKDVAGPDEGVDRANVAGKKRKRGGPALRRQQGA